MRRGLTPLMAVAGGVTVANMYYPQPLLGPIAADLGVAPGAAGLLMSSAQIGYATGLLLVVPLADRFENRSLIVCALTVAALALVAVALAPTALLLGAALLVLGLAACVTQVIVPLADHLAPQESRGRVVGLVVSGALFGQMLARPVASVVAEGLGWRAVFALSACLVAAVALALRRWLPRRSPPPGFHYRTLFASLARLLARSPALRRRAGYQSGVFAIFALFWGAAPLMLAGPAYGMSQIGIAAFALVGVAGALVAPYAGHGADRGATRPLTFAALGAVTLAMLLAFPAERGTIAALAALTLAGLVLDAGVAGNLVLSQRAVLGIDPQSRGRLNGIFFSIVYLGAAAGSALGTWSYATGGWTVSVAIGLAIAVAVLAAFATEGRNASITKHHDTEKT